MSEHFPCGSAPRLDGRCAPPATGGRGSFVKTYTCVGERSRDSGSDYVAEFRQLGPHYRSRIACIDLAGVRVSRSLDEGASEMQGQWFEDAVGLAFVWGERTAIVGRGNRTPRPVLAGVGTDTSIVHRGRSQNFRIGVRGEALRRLLGEPTTAEAVEPWLRRGARWPCASAPAEWRLQRAIAAAARFAEHAAELEAPPRAAEAALAEDAAAALVELLREAGGRPATDDGVARPRRRLVADAVTLLDAFPDEPVSVAGLCTQLRVSERTLQRAFVECLGIGPLRYERERRLHAVHGAILADGDERTVTELAMTFGFWHLGRFAAAYAKLYGCSPSETRRRVWCAHPDRGESHLPQGGRRPR